MDVSWCFHCDLLVEELNPRTNARIAQWNIKNTRIVLGDEAVSLRAGAPRPCDGLSQPSMSL